MLEKIMYRNHLGESVETAKDGVYANYHDLRDYRWEYESNANRITRFSRGIIDKTLPLVIFCETEEQGVETKNRLMEIAEKDVLTRQPGEIWISGYCLKGYVTQSTKGNFLMNQRYMTVSLTITTDDPVWRRELNYHLLPEDALQDDEEIVTEPEEQQEEALLLEDGCVFADFPFDLYHKTYRKVQHPLFDLPFDFKRIRGRRVINNEAFTGSDFIMTIWGFVDRPRILIAGHPYEVDVLVYEGERVVIDSAAGTVVKIGRMGEETNLYNARGKEYSIFEKIPSGYQTVSWAGTFGIDLTIYDERSEPKWSL